MRQLFAVVTVALLAAPASGASSQERWSADIAAKVDKVFERMDKPTSPGCALAVIRDGRTVYTRGYGMANLDHDIVITPSSVFHIASVSKEFTATAILLLAQDGKLSLDDEVRSHVPELPDFGRRITIRHLLHHTSGLRDQWELLGLAGWRYSRDLITDDDVLQLMARQKDLNFAPGEQYMYSNTGYTLLATIVKRVSGQSFREFTTSRIFKPLGMARTHFRDDFDEIVKDQAYGYVPAGDTFRLSVTNFDTAGATSLLTTVEDMALWDRNFYDGRVGGRALVDSLLTNGILNSGEKIDYAYGIMHNTYRGLATVGHGGSDAGYRADFVRFPGERLSVACLCNLSTSNPAELTRRVADIVLADRLGPPDTKAADDRPAVTVSAQDLGRYAGLYWNREGDAFRRFTLKDGALLFGFAEPGVSLKPIASATFAGPNADFVFDAATAGRVRMTETARTGRAKSIAFDAVDQFKPSASEVAEYAGAYRSDEIDPIFRIAAENGTLVLRRLKNSPVTLEPLTRDAFRTPSATIRFTRDAAGRLTGFIFNGGRIRGFRLSRAAGG